VTERLHARTAQLVCDGTIISVGGIADEIAPKVPNDNTFQSEFARLSVRRGWLVRYYLENWIDHDGDLPVLHGTLIRRWNGGSRLEQQAAPTALNGVQQLWAALSSLESCAPHGGVAGQRPADRSMTPAAPTADPVSGVVLHGRNVLRGAPSVTSRPAAPLPPGA
jgi:hypothetical protein